MASVASSAASERSCVLNGQVMNVEEALDRVTRDAQMRLTDLQMALRRLCAAEDQQIDDEEDFKECVRLEDEVTDFVSGLAELLSELPQIAGDIRGDCPKECKAWWVEHKAQRKAAAKAHAEEVKAAAKERKELVKQMNLASIAEESKR
jgi:hypothetical protein